MRSQFTGRSWKSLIAFVVVIMLLAAPASSVLAASYGEAQIIPHALNVRSGPSAGYSVKGLVYQYEWVDLLGRNADSSWAKIETDDGLQGWVSTRYINPNVALSSLPVVTAKTEPTAVVNTPVLNVREGPSPYHDIVTMVYRYTVLSLIGRNGDASWVEVRVSGETGWVDSSYITPYYRLMDLPLTSSGVQPPAPPADGAKGTVFAQALSVRSGPGIGFAAFDVLYFGTTVNVRGRDSSGGWLAIDLPHGGKGWASSSYISLNVPLMSLKVIYLDVASGEVWTGALYLRSSPRMGNNIILTMPHGAHVKLLGRNYDASWLKVDYNGTIGWAGSGGISTGYPLMDLPFAGN